MSQIWSISRMIERMRWAHADDILSEKPLIISVGSKSLRVPNFAR